MPDDLVHSVLKICDEGSEWDVNLCLLLTCDKLRWRYDRESDSITKAESNGQGLRHEGYFALSWENTAVMYIYRKYWVLVLRQCSDRSEMVLILRISSGSLIVLETFTCAASLESLDEVRKASLYCVVNQRHSPDVIYAWLRLRNWRCRENRKVRRSVKIQEVLMPMGLGTRVSGNNRDTIQVPVYNWLVKLW